MDGMDCGYSMGVIGDVFRMNVNHRPGALCNAWEGSIIDCPAIKSRT